MRKRPEVTNRDWFSELYGREYAPLCRVAYGILGSREDAESIVQEAFARAYARVDRLRRYDRPGGWLYRVVVRLAERQRRKAGRCEPITFEPVFLDRHVDLGLLSAIADLPSRQRQVVAMTYLADMNSDDIADALGCSAATVRVHLHRARKALQENMTEEDQ